MPDFPHFQSQNKKSSGGFPRRFFLLKCIIAATAARPAVFVRI
jgi:hypothetical protein